MKTNLVDTNVILRYLVENPDSVQRKFKGVFTFFPRVERGEIKIELCELVLFEAFFVLPAHLSSKHVLRRKDEKSSGKLRKQMGEIKIEWCEFVLFEAFFVLTKLYEVPQKKAADKLSGIVAYKGVVMPDKPLILSCLKILQTESIDLVDAYLLAVSKKKNI